ncbi:MAG: hypothetical protein RRC34_05080 [Lentisphaeria bacterium]|nr:hypothetical protein [Lentisphaeria bacterium]
MSDPSPSHDDMKRCLALASLGLFLCLPMIIWQKLPQTDARNYYIPMIQAFASGNWDHAYWPMIPPLFPTFSGILATLLPLSAFTAAKVASSLFFAGTVFPLYFLTTRVFKNTRVATGAVVLYLFCDRLLRYGAAGILDSGKIFFFTCSVFFLIASIRERTVLRTVFFSLSLAGLSLIRGEGIAIAAVLGGIFLLFELRGNQNAFTSFFRRSIPLQSVFVLALTAALLSPWLFYQFKHVGYPVVDSRQVGFLPFKQVLKNKRALSLPRESAEIKAFRAVPKELSAVPRPSPAEKNKATLWNRLFEQIFKGFYPLYLLLYVPVIVQRIRKRQWTGPESLLLFLGVAHTLILIISLGGTWVQKRYVIAALPLFLGWAAMGYFRVWDKVNETMKNSRLRLLPKCIVGAVILGMLWSATSRIRPPSKESKTQWLLLNERCVRWLAANSSTYQLPDFPALKSDQGTYHSGQLPTIIGGIDLPVFKTHAETVSPGSYRKHYTPDQFVRLCELKRVQFIVVDKTLTGLGVDLPQLLGRPEFVLLTSLQVGEQSAAILGFRKHLKSVD